MGNGQYIDAADAAELGEAVAQAVQPLYDVLDASGNVVASGQVGGPSVRLPPGTYGIGVQTEPVRVYEGIAVPAGERIRFEMDEEAVSAIDPRVSTAGGDGGMTVIAWAGAVDWVGVARSMGRIRL